MRRHGRRSALLALLLAAFAVLTAPAAFAASEIGDSGELPATSQEPGPPGPLNFINGSISSTTDRDMYKVCLTGGGDFGAVTVGFAGFDTQLFLLDAQGRAVYSNDDAPSSRQSRLPSFHPLTPTAAGTYYLAIAPHNWDPNNTPAGPLFPDRSGTAGPEHSQPITDWVGSNLVAMGGYSIGLAGTRSCVVPDEAAPAIDLDTPADGATYERDETVIADYACEDEAGGSGVATCTGTVPDGQPVDTATLGTKSFTVEATDARGNARSVTHTYTVADGTDPTVSLTTPSDGAVYARGQQVAADYSCADEAGGSGLASCEGSVADGQPVDTTTLGTHSFTVTARDGQDNSASVTHTYRVEDVTKPTIDLSTPADGARYELGAQVAADYSCADDEGGSGIASCAGDVADGANIDTATLGPKSFTVSAEDNEGNAESVTHSYTVVDTAGPSIELRSPADGAVFGVDQEVVADYSCADQGSGVVSCSGDLPPGARIDTSDVGVRSFTVRAVDGAGNVSTTTATYRIGFQFEGFFAPLKNRPHVNVWKAGKPVPVIFSLDGYQGRGVIASGYPRSTGIRCGTSPDTEGAERAKALGHTRLRYKPRRDLYIYMWQTNRRWAGSCRQFVLKLDDGSYHRADFRFLPKKPKRPHHDDDDDD